MSGFTREQILIKVAAKENLSGADLQRNHSAEIWSNWLDDALSIA
jgi:hypothetical protein